MTVRISSVLLTTMAIVGGMACIHPAPASAQVDMSCIVRPDVVPADGRLSPLDSLTFPVAGQEVKTLWDSRPLPSPD